jgi:hypothetical protein
MESNSQDSSLIDLKLERLTDCKDAHNSRFLKKIFLLYEEKKTNLRDEKQRAGRGGGCE